NNAGARSVISTPTAGLTSWSLRTARKQNFTATKARALAYASGSKDLRPILWASAQPCACEQETNGDQRVNSTRGADTGPRTVPSRCWLQPERPRNFSCAGAAAKRTPSFFHPKQTKSPSTPMAVSPRSDRLRKHARGGLRLRHACSFRFLILILILIPQ